ncbi:site-specific integrase [Streptomyces sp. TRM49041]|uniref:tyrosine-type recombinase/integrase n=1 Tax=Streptomyces sp. TRM49041 TaxID=2603216 RepID=UPI0021CC58D8|nr:site-specific integrase [Streptomyces sp. TRM49041]
MPCAAASRPRPRHICRAGGDKLTPHVLRHFCASELYLGGLDLIAIQEVLGHSWIATTMRYVNPRELHQTGEKLQVGSSQGGCAAFQSRYALGV